MESQVIATDTFHLPLSHVLGPALLAPSDHNHHPHHWPLPKVITKECRLCSKCAPFRYRFGDINGDTSYGSNALMASGPKVKKHRERGGEREGEMNSLQWQLRELSAIILTAVSQCKSGN